MLATPRRQILYPLERLLYVRRIFLEDGKLFVLPTVGGGGELVPVTETSFRKEGEPVAPVFADVAGTMLRWRRMEAPRWR